ncbi:hypothetical protein [Actinomadura sp. RB99]|uniref:hypothetical protein n=1 Tax=Actinomadura sp. RB99 TaxID=2691577 RepID=UPI001687D557|nr:hypothetical protein [Actinomadura sp. RB99]
MIVEGIEDTFSKTQLIQVLQKKNRTPGDLRLRKVTMMSVRLSGPDGVALRSLGVCR